MTASAQIEVADHKQIPSLLTTSAKELTSHYTTDIVEMRALGGRRGQNTRWLDESYGMYVDEPGQEILRWEYQQRRDTSGEVQNPLDADTLELRHKQIEDELPPYEDEQGDLHPPDLTIDKLVVEVEDEELVEHTNATDPVFELTFVSDPVEKSGWSKETQGLEVNKGVYKQGFKLRNLNLHRMVEVANKYSDEKTQEIVSWNGPGHIRPRCPATVAANICGKHIPGEYLGLKLFTVEEEEQLVPGELVTGEEAKGVYDNE